MTTGFRQASIRRQDARQGFWKQTQGAAEDLKRPELNYKEGKQTLMERNLVKGTTKQLTASVGVRLDSLSAIFMPGSQPLTVRQNFPLADSMRTVTVTMKVEAKEEIKTPAGTFPTVQVQPTADRVVKEPRKDLIWYTTMRGTFRCR